MAWYQFKSSEVNDTMNNSTVSEPAITNTLLFHFRVVLQEKVMKFQVTASLLVNYSYSITYTNSKSHSGKKFGAHFSLKVWAVPLGMVYPRVPFLDIFLCFLTSLQRHIKPFLSIRRTRLMQLLWAASQRNSPPPNANQTGRKRNQKVIISCTVALKWSTAVWVLTKQAYLLLYEPTIH